MEINDSTPKEELKNINLNSDLEKDTVNTRKLQAFSIIIFGFLVLILLVVYFVNSFTSKSKDEEPVKKSDTNIASTVKSKEFNLKVEPKSIEEETQEQKIDNLFADKKEIVEQQNPAVTRSSYSPPVYKKELIKGLTPTVLKNDERVSDNSNVPYNYNPNEVKANDLANLSNPNSNDEFVGKTFTPTIAKMSTFNPNLFLPKGSYIGCSLKTKLISTIQGGLACTVSNDIYSSNGNVLLIEKGSTVTGMFKSGQIDDGTDRLFVIWQEIRTPNNLVIPIYSGASDELGGSGIEGWVDHKWMLRFGSAVLLSIVDDSFNVLAYKATNSNNNNNIDYTENTRENAKNMANTALEKFIDIKPTLYKNQGDVVGIYVNRDVDFSKVYKLSKGN
jgi:type IV secretion system protein VirB10